VFACTAQETGKKDAASDDDGGLVHGKKHWLRGGDYMSFHDQISQFEALKQDDCTIFFCFWHVLCFCLNPPWRNLMHVLSRGSIRNPLGTENAGDGGAGA
jgi:hypothetical protein